MSFVPLTKSILYVFTILVLLFFISCEHSTPPNDTTEPIIEHTTKAAQVSTPAVEPRQTFTSFSFGACNSLEEGSCYCDYQAQGTANKAPSFFVSDRNKNACVKVNDQWQTLLNREAVYREKLREKVAYAKNNVDWIFLPKNGSVRYFGAPIPKGLNELDFLVHVLLMIEEIPAEISVRNEAEGMAVREVRDLAAEAIILAKKKQAKSDYTFFKEELYYNDSYQVIVDTKPITSYEGEANVYEGDLILKDKEGNILHTQPIKGTCGC
ncbi:MAG: hypothetical protein ACRBFS_04230 [Aureispira sp.]